MKKRNIFFWFMGMYLLSTFMPTKAENPTYYSQDNTLQTIEYVQEPINPTLREHNGLKTKSIASTSVDATKMIAKFTSTKPIGESMTFVLNVSEKDTIRMDWGNGTITKHPLSPSSTGSSISGQKQGDTIRIYAYSATTGDFTNNSIRYLDIRLWDKIESLNCEKNLLSTIDLSKNTLLQRLYLNFNSLSTIDLSKNIELQDLDLNSNSLSTIDLSKNIKLQMVALGDNSLSTIDLSKNIKLQMVALDNNSLSTLDLSKNIELQMAGLDNNSLSTIDLSKNTLLKYLYLNSNSLSTIDLSKNIELQMVSLRYNLLSTIDLSKNINLLGLSLRYNLLSTIDLSKNIELQEVYLDSNSLSIIDLSKNTKLTYLDLRSNKFDIPSLPSLRKGTTYLYFPQKPEGILLPQTINMADTLDASYYASTLDSAGIEQKSKFTWYIENADLTLQALTNKDYQTIEDAVFIFNRSGNLKCYVQNAAFPASTVPSSQGFTGFESTFVHVNPSIPDTIAIEDVQAHLNIKTYANNKTIYVELPSESSYSVEIYDLQGRKIISRKNASNTINFPVKNNGVYLLKIENATENWIQKIIVQ